MVRIVAGDMFDQRHSSRMSDAGLLGPHHRHRVDAEGTPHRRPARRRGCETEHRGRRGERDQVQPRHAVEELLDTPAGDRGRADAEAHPEGNGQRTAKLSATTPTTVKAMRPSMLTLLPMISMPGARLRAADSFTMPTRSAAMSSAAVNLRPRSSGTPRTSKYSGDTCTSPTPMLAAASSLRASSTGATSATG